MRNKPNLALAGFAAAMFLLMLLFAFMWEAAERRASQPPVADTITIDHWDTTYLPSPPDTITSEEKIPVPVPYYIKETDTVHDSVLVVLPYEHHHARVDSLLDIWYSGYQAKIDSIVAYKHLTTQIIKQPYEVTKMPNLTLDLGAGAMWHEQAVKPFAVGKLNLNRPHTTFTAFGAVNPDGDWAAGLTVTYRLNLIK